MFASKDVFLKSSGGGYTIARSVRFRSSATAYLNRTMTSSFTSQRIFTFSFWLKRGTLSTAQSIFDRNQATNTNQFAVGLNLDNTFAIVARTSGTSTISLNLTTSAVFRDPSAWYHFVIAVDNTQATLANRGQIYVNGVLQALGTQTATQNVNYHLLTGLTYDIGRTSLGATQYFDGYLAEFNFVDGQALTPSSFGAYNIYGVWQPAKYQGTYGTNGFYLDFESFGTAAALGTDFSGNGNTWTVNNLSVTAGATYDSMTDVPTLTSATANNYCVLNPLNKGINQTIANGNLTNNSSGHGTVLTTIGVSSGLWYAESTLTATGPGGIGFTSNPAAESSYTTISGKWWCYDNGGNFIINNQTSGTSYAPRFSSGQVWQWAIDNNNGKVWIGVNNAWLDSTNGTTGNPATGANPTFTFTAGTLIWPFLEGAGNPTWNANFGQRPFTYTPPSGFVALNTYNLSTPTIPNGATQMAATLYTGNGTNPRSVVNTTNGTSFQPDWVWTKDRSTTNSHALYDVVRGVSKNLRTNATNAEATISGVTAFNSNGFTVGADADSNANGNSLVAWQWKANGAGVTNTSGSITSTVSANTTAGFSVVTYTGTSANATVGHGIGVAPSMIIVKSISTVTSWSVYHQSIGAGNELILNSTAASAASANSWNSTAPTSSVFSVGTAGSTNTSPRTYVAYCFAAVAGYSAFGSYTGNGSTDGPFVFLGFRPRFLLMKSAVGSTGSWWLYDSSRDTYNVEQNFLMPNNSNAETVVAGPDFLSNGFKLRTSTGDLNTNGSTFIYMAFAENPFKYSLAR